MARRPSSRPLGAGNWASLPLACDQSHDPVTRASAPAGGGDACRRPSRERTLSPIILVRRPARACSAAQVDRALACERRSGAKAGSRGADGPDASGVRYPKRGPPGARSRARWPRVCMPSKGCPKQPVDLAWEGPVRASSVNVLARTARAPTASSPGDGRSAGTRHGLLRPGGTSGPGRGT